MIQTILTIVTFAGLTAQFLLYQTNVRRGREAKRTLRAAVDILDKATMQAIGGVPTTHEELLRCLYKIKDEAIKLDLPNAEHLLGPEAPDTVEEAISQLYQDVEDDTCPECGSTFACNEDYICPDCRAKR